MTLLRKIQTQLLWARVAAARENRPDAKFVVYVDIVLWDELMMSDLRPFVNWASSAVEDPTINGAKIYRVIEACDHGYKIYEDRFVALALQPNGGTRAMFGK